jgi:hypothetical protein
VQVAQYEQVASKTAEAIEDSMLQLAGGALDPASAGDMMKGMLGAIHQVEKSMDLMKEHGHQFWEPRSLEGGDVSAQLMTQCADLAAARLSDLDATRLYAAMQSNGMNQFLLACEQSGNGTVSRFLKEIMVAVGKRAGGAPEAVEQQVQQMMQKVEDEFESATLPEGVLEAVQEVSSNWKLEG